MRNLIVIATLILTACATTTYYKNGATQADFDRDKYDCQQVAYQYTANLGFNGNPLVAGSAYKQCMLNKHGYRTTP